MTIEVELKRIADALEAIASNQGIVADVPGDEPAAKPTASKTAVKKTIKKTAKKKVVGKKPAAAETDLTIKDDVRPVLKRLREEVSHAAVKSLLKKYGASTLQQLDASRFEAIINDACEELGIDPGDDDDAGLGDDDDDL